MREQADRVEEALSRRIAETEESTRALEDELKAVSCFFPLNKLCQNIFEILFFLLVLSVTYSLLFMNHPFIFRILLIWTNETNIPNS